MRAMGRTAVLVGIALAGAGTGLGQTERTPTPPTFTDAQVTAGNATYRRHCAACHGAQLEGQHLAPGLTGERFDRTWRGRPAEALMFQLRRMPPARAEDAVDLDDDAYAGLLAYLLDANGLEAGRAALPADLVALAAVTIPIRDGAEVDPDAPVAGSPDVSARLAGLGPVSDAVLRAPPAADWVHWGRTYDGQNYSPLTGITRENVRTLQPVWRAPLREGTGMPTPLVRDGVMFLQTMPDTVLALDGSTGDVLWRSRHVPSTEASRKMGLALHDDTVLVPTSDLHVLALDARSGEVLWNHAIDTDPAPGGRGRYQLRSAPLVVGDKVIQGVAASFVARGGFIVSIDLETGDEIWRFHTIARPGEPGGESWNGLPLDARSGGSVWHQGTYDAALNLIYFGVAPTYDTGPLLHPAADAGVTSDALYTNCTIALNADTGELVWYYQHVANDQWDLDWVFERQIVELPVRGQLRKVVMTVGKMAIVEALDAATGEYLFSVDSGTQNVITAIDPVTGAKTIDPAKLPSLDRATVVCPGVSGARSWPPTSYSPRTSLLYVPLTEWCNRFGPDGFRLLTSGVGITPAQHPDSDDGTMGRLQAIDVEGRALAWARDQAAPLSTSVLATAGGVVFAGDLDPALKAFDDRTGARLWEAPLDDLPSSSLVTYAIGDTQYVAVIVGLRNNHVNDLARTHRAFRERRGETDLDLPRAGAAIWVFGL